MTTDQSIFAHDGHLPNGRVPLLAFRPCYFQHCGQLRFSESPWEKKSEVVFTSRTARLSLPLYGLRFEGNDIYLAILDGVYGFDFTSRPAIMIQIYSSRLHGDSTTVYARLSRDGQSVRRITTSSRDAGHAMVVRSPLPLSPLHSDYLPEPGELVPVCHPRDTAT